MTMKITICVIAIVLSAAVGAQETKPVPKDSVRVFVPGCSKGYIFTAAERTEEHPGSPGIPEGMHLRMNGPKETMNAIKRQEGAMIEISGLMRKDQIMPPGIGNSRVRVTGGPSPTGSSTIPSPTANQAVIDVEGWRSIPGRCPSR
jgi:hypothetical protein